MSTLKLKKDEFVSINQIIITEIPAHLDNHPEDSITTKFSFMINYNADMIMPIIKSIIEASKTKIEEYAEYEKRRKSILESLSEKNKAGQPIRQKNGYFIGKDNRIKADELLRELNDKYADAIEKRKGEEKEISEMLKEEVEISIAKTSFSNFPAWLDPWQTKALRHFAFETDDEILKLIQ